MDGFLYELKFLMGYKKVKPRARELGEFIY